MKTSHNRFLGACKAFYADYKKKVKHSILVLLAIVSILLSIIVTVCNNRPAKYTSEQINYYQSIAKEIYDNIPNDIGITDEFSVNIGTNNLISFHFKEMKNPDLYFQFSNGYIPCITKKQSNAEIYITSFCTGFIIGILVVLVMFTVLFLLYKVFSVSKKNCNKFSEIFREYLKKEDLKNFSDNEYVSDFIEVPTETSKEGDVFKDIDNSLNKM